jgi:hypothetical protein
MDRPTVARKNALSLTDQENQLVARCKRDGDNIVGRRREDFMAGDDERSVIPCLGRLYAAIEAGTIDSTDPTLKERVAALKAGRDKAVEALDYAKKSSATPIEIDPIAIDRSTRLMREQLTSGDVAARKAYLASVVDAIIVSEDKIRIVGSNDNIRSTFGPQGQPQPRVRKSVQEWCPGAESGISHNQLTTKRNFCAIFNQCHHPCRRSCPRPPICSASRLSHCQALFAHLGCPAPRARSALPSACDRTSSNRSWISQLISADLSPFGG